MMRKYIPYQAPALSEEGQNVDYKYREFAPDRRLEDYVACYWTVEFRASRGDKLHRILPDGCVDIIFDLGAGFVFDRAFAVGLMTEFATLNFTTDQSLFGIRLYADTARYFIGIPVSELTGYSVSLDRIWGREGVELAEEMSSVHGGISRVIDKVERRLLERLSRIDIGSDGILLTGMRYLYEGRGMLPARSLAEKLGYSERNVRRIFLRELGLSPKELSGIIRFQNTLRELKEGNNRRGYAADALRYGYSDQPHLIHAFKRYYGLTPLQVFKNASME
ncbi:helix-turn-helix transcriptional regulator [Cohnella lupini]|uniref:Helix-turn-helix protein n=1 Tax=Cohnella lupini TaxID=1294267 RepID=A0A3D9IN67_9BACL|nr:helix-turn-helix transcriptional regulator [Cohnella lupini]RED63223.1 helix-turn-helix protein [Cohnella lupini]